MFFFLPKTSRSKLTERPGGSTAGQKDRERPHRRKLWALTILSLTIALGVPLSIKFYNSYLYHVEKQTRYMMDTYVTIYAIGIERITSPAVRIAFEKMQAIDAKFNKINPESSLYAFNHRGIPIEDPQVVEVARAALEVARLTDGAFDITVEPLVDLWGFYGDSPRVPSESEIKAVQNKTGYRYLSIENGRLIKSNPDIRIDLGGIAKGYAVRQAAIALRENGVDSALINAGGDIYALGKKVDDLWKVGIRSPRGEDILGYLEVQDLAVMGSGDYERFFMEGGKRYHHILDPKTGYPKEGVQGTTLIHPDPMIADAWNTAIFVLGPEKGLALVEKIPGMEAMMVTASGKTRYSSGLKNALRMSSMAK